MRTSLKPFPGRGIKSKVIELLDTDVAANQSNVVLLSVPLPAGQLTKIKANILARDTGDNACAGYELTAHMRNLPALYAKATGTLTATVNPANAETVTIGSKVYTFQTTLTNVDGNVKIGANLAATLTNLANAINGTGGTAGTDYAAAMTAHPSVTATATATTVVVTAITAGTAGNSIASTETCTNSSWGAATLASGVDASALIGSVNAIVAEDDSNWNATITVDGATNVAQLKVTSDATHTTRFFGVLVVETY